MSPWHFVYSSRSCHKYLFSQASSSKFRIVQSFSWDVVDLSRRVPNFDEIRL